MPEPLPIAAADGLKRRCWRSAARRERLPERSRAGARCASLRASVVGAPLLIVAALLSSSGASAQTRFEQACEQMAAAAQMRIVFEDRPVTRDDSRSTDVLKRLLQAGSSPYHSVLGLTHAEPSASLEFSPQLLIDAGGRVCGVASGTLKLGFSALQVYLANDLKDSCRRFIVDEHEQEHVAVWRNHFRAGARMIETVLRNKLGQAAYFADPEQARAVLRQRAETLISALLKSLQDGVGASHQQIDSAGAYRYLEGRLRACP